MYIPAQSVRDHEEQGSSVATWPPSSAQRGRAVNLVPEDGWPGNGSGPSLARSTRTVDLCSLRSMKSEAELEHCAHATGVPYVLNDHRRRKRLRQEDQEAAKRRRS
jgi:hypothetical protein